jgi:hypothetical protein
MLLNGIVAGTLFRTKMEQVYNRPTYRIDKEFGSAVTSLQSSQLVSYH